MHGVLEAAAKIAKFWGVMIGAVGQNKSALVSQFTHPGARTSQLEISRHNIPEGIAMPIVDYVEIIECPAVSGGASSSNDRKHCCD